MGKRQTSWTENKITKYQKEGRGQGELSNYKPWLTIQDVPSKGRVHRLIGWKTSREHHLLSDLEFNYLCYCDWIDEVIDIREQFPLDRELTVQIAEKMNLKHPMDIQTQTPLVMTTDFLLTIRTEKTNNYLARTIKYEKDLNDKRVMEKFEIERKYWEKKGVDWGIVTEKEFSSIFLNNLKFLRDSFFTEQNEELSLFLNEWSNFNGILLNNLKYFDEKYNFDFGTGISLYKNALAKKKLQVDMNKKISIKEDVDNILLRSQTKNTMRLA